MEKDQLYQDARRSILEADEGLAMATIEEAECSGLDLFALLQEGFAPGNQAVGDLFESGAFCLPELILSTEIMKLAIEEVERRSPGKDGPSKGKVLIATVEGDVHEIGKGLVASTLKSYGFEVIDLGREVPVETIIEKAEEYQVDIIATSALLTSTLKEQRKLEDALRSLGLRNKYKTMVGGAPCTLRWGRRIGADAYSEDAIDAVRQALRLLDSVRGSGV